MKPGLISSVITFLITAATALIALFSQEGVAEFSDISQVAYASGLLGALIAAATTYKARITEMPFEEWKKGKQKGFISFRMLNILASVCFAVIVVSMFSGCSTIDSKPWQPIADCADIDQPKNNQIAACYTVITQLAQAADAAADYGFITSEQETKFLDKLEKAAFILQFARDSPDSETKNELEDVVIILEMLHLQIPQSG